MRMFFLVDNRSLIGRWALRNLERCLSKSISNAKNYVLVSLIKRSTWMIGRPIKIEPDIFGIRVDVGVDFIYVEILLQPSHDICHMAVLSIETPQVNLGVGVASRAVVM